MTVIARFEVIPVREGSMSIAIAHALRALDRYPVSYETTATDTVIEAETVDQVFEAVRAAHQAIPDDRVITSIEIDEDRRRPQSMHERVASVEQQLGHPAQRSQGAPQQDQPAGTGSRQAQPARTTQQARSTGSGPAQPPRSGPPVQVQQAGAGSRSSPPGQQQPASQPRSPPNQPALPERPAPGR